jgi:hypothetical protein
VDHHDGSEEDVLVVKGDEAEDGGALVDEEDEDEEEIISIGISSTPSSKLSASSMQEPRRHSVRPDCAAEVHLMC